jgi:lipopolysaccharide cholinephosphotransferase
MRELTVKECKEIQLKILIKVAQFCEDHDISYSLSYGTLIGAIRHKGFIPWDDDIDIIMLRNEYEKFLSLYKDDDYVLIDGDKVSNHYHAVVSDLSTKLVFLKSEASNKLYQGGVWIDIFPIDKVPDDVKDYKSLKRKMLLYCRLERLGEVSHKENIALYLIHLLLKPFVHFWGNKANQLMRSFEKEDVKTVGDLSLWYLHYPSFPLYYLKEFIDVEFEGHTFKSMKHYDDFLRGIYGDYMKLPPIEQRIPRHNYKTYWREDN